MTTKQSLSVLLVDDELRITELLSFALRKQPYEITTAQSAKQALGIMGDQNIDILVTDIRMPGMDGLELTRQVRTEHPHTQVIMVSAHGDLDSAVEALKLGAVDFLQKPVDPKVLQLSINSSAEKLRLRTELNISNRALEQEKEMLAVTLNSIGDAVIATDLDGNVTLLNGVAEGLTGWLREDAYTEPLTKVFHIISEKTRAICENPVEKVLKTGRIIGLANHTALIAKDGNETSIADSAAPIRNSQDEIIGTVLVFRDVTHENMMNTELLKTKKLESVGLLAGGIAHDFNNVLTGIMGNINLARSLTNKDHEAYGFLEIAENASKRASKLTHQLLTFSKGGEPIVELTSIYSLIKECARFSLTGSGIACRIDQGAELWGAVVDPGQIDQVIQNILLNARQAMPEGGTINILCENFIHSDNEQKALPIGPGNYLRIVISDEGIGIPPELIEKIFDPYFTTKQMGSGLGMATSQAIINKHGGFIGCTSKPGQGSAFTIYLPAERTLVAKKVTETTELKGSGRIMVMDDEAMIGTLAENMLDSCGYNAVPVRDGEQALALYKEAMDSSQPYDIVIMDLTIPGGLGGKETISKLLAMDPKATAIVSSGYSNDPVMANYRDYGFKGCLSKPYLKDSLTGLVSKLMSEAD
ncbi:MAG: response regulator [Gammaproteobacteria bacterium]|nr:response regulator [Gammaproteobacteria bacterium]